MFYFKSSIQYHTDDVGHFLNLNVIITLQWPQPNDSYMTSYTTNANWIHMKIFFFYPTRDNMGEIRISIPSENLVFPYPVCKK